MKNIYDIKNAEKGTEYAGKRRGRLAFAGF